jgi:uncharacterized protein (TIGR03067 family)
MLRGITLPLGCALLLAYSSALPVMAQKQNKPATPTPEELRAIKGKWHLLLAHEADANLLDRPEYKNSSVAISDNQFQWSSADGKTLFSATCNWKHVGKPAWEVDLTPAGNTAEAVTLPGIAVLYDNDILKISWRRINLDKGRTANFNGNKEHTFLLLSRNPPAKISGKSSLVGQWQMLAALDDSFDKLGSGRTSAVALFESDSFAWKSSPNNQGSKYAGGYTLDLSAQPQRIKFNITFPPPGSGATPTPKDGFVPGIVEFLDDDTLRLCYRESGWKNTDPPEARQYPEGFYSDGNLNLWILRRAKP